MTMSRELRDRPKFKFKRLTRIEIGENKHLITSLGENNSISLAASVAAQVDGKLMTMPLIGALRISRPYLLRFIHSLIWIAIRLRDDEIADEDKEFVKKLRVLAADTQTNLETHMREIGFPPTAFLGQSYSDYPQRED